jgi:hypothetical protein
MCKRVKIRDSTKERHGVHYLKKGSGSEYAPAALSSRVTSTQASPSILLVEACDSGAGVQGRDPRPRASIVQYLRTFLTTPQYFIHHSASANTSLLAAASRAVEVFRSIYNRQKTSWTFSSYRDRVETLVLRDLVCYARRDPIACHYACYACSERWDSARPISELSSRKGGPAEEMGQTLPD